MKQMILAGSAASLCLLAWTAPAAAQVGIRGGLSLNDFFGDGVENTEQTQNLSLGLSMGIIRFGDFQIVAEGFYRQKGAGWSAFDALAAGGGPAALDSAQLADLVSGDLTGRTLEFGLDYVEVPLLLRWNLPMLGSRLRPYLSGGPAFAWRIDCGVTVAMAAGAGEEPEADCQDLSQENLKETLREYELGMVLAGGLDLMVLGGAGALNLDVRFTRGLSRLSEGLEGPEVRNQAFSAMLGYTFGFH